MMFQDFQNFVPVGFATLLVLVFSGPEILWQSHWIEMFFLAYRNTEGEPKFEVCLGMFFCGKNPKNPQFSLNYF